MNIEYQGEHLFPGQLGHALVIIAFTAALLSFLAFTFSTIKRGTADESSWRKLARTAWIAHTLAILGTIAALYYLTFSHYFEYDYVRRTSAVDMPLKYLISSMWSQQQGSFLLWLFWHAVLGSVVLFTVNKRWSSPAMAVFSAVQLVITSMILGVFVDRWIPLVLLVLALNAPFWILLHQDGKAGWKSLVPILNIVTVLQARKRVQPLQETRSDDDTRQESQSHAGSRVWFLLLLSLPINLIVFVWLPLHWNELRDFLFASVELGVSPFQLSREQFSTSSVFLIPDYVNMISGQGLNPLLENYWMVIHPPTLFLGFASTLVPFALAVAGLWTKDYTTWWKPALPYTVFSVMILGTGVMMGGVWAYEALSFGGFWAWDPVENASLIPWLTLLAGMHTLIIFKSTGRALRITFVFLIATTFFILYSTFLTRSGILGDTSVHAFTDLGMMGQLIILILAVIYPAVVMLVTAWKQLPRPKEEEHVLSREFWMFIGSIVLAVSAIHITMSTSLPVINSIFGTVLATPGDAVEYYNSVQVWIGVLIALLSGFGLFLRFKKTPMQGLTQLLVHAGTALAGTVLIGLAITVDEAPYYILLFSGLFAISANLHYFFKTLRKKFKLSGAAISHLGFGIIMIGLVVALANSSVISKNISGLAYTPNKEDSTFNRYNVRMNLGETVPMGDYNITYLGRQQDSINFYYRILYERFDKSTGELRESFELRPHLMDHPDMGIVANPATKHYISKDIFTHVSSIPQNSLKRDITVPEMETHTIVQGDSFWTSSGLVVFEGFTPLSDGQDFSVIANMKLKRLNETFTLKPVYSIKGNRPTFSEARVESLDFSVSLTNIEPGVGFTFRTFEIVDWVIMKAIVFPFINLLWLGIVMTIVGMLIVLRKRIMEFIRTSKR